MVNDLLLPAYRWSNGNYAKYYLYFELYSSGRYTLADYPVEEYAYIGTMLQTDGNRTYRKIFDRSLLQRDIERRISAVPGGQAIRGGADAVRHPPLLIYSLRYQTIGYFLTSVKLGSQRPFL